MMSSRMQRSKKLVAALGLECSYSVLLHHKHQRKMSSFVRKDSVNQNAAAIYVHWPYCKRRCTYCNFNKYIDKFVDHQRMRENLVRETETLLQLSSVSKVTSVFFGGGTPSLAEPLTFEALLACIKKHVDFSNTAEVSMEVNPTALEGRKLSEFRDAGINRVSLGVQTLGHRGLKVLGRDHSAEDSLRVLEIAKKLFPGHVSVDLIFGWPRQTLEGWMDELRQLIPVCDKHISLYQLTLERGTQLFKQIHSKEMVLPSSHTSEEMYFQALQILSEFGFERYEVSNFAKEGSYSKHNLSYWTGQQYIGIGPGAHGRFIPRDSKCREARIQTLEPHNWLWEVENYGHATRKRSVLSKDEQLEELLITSLRTKWGISQDLWNSVEPRISLTQMFGSSKLVQSHIESGLLVLDSKGLCASPNGLNILDSLLSDLLLVLEKNFNSEQSDVT